MRDNINTVKAVETDGKYIFISYSSKDKEIVDHDCAELRRHGVDLWIDDKLIAGYDWRVAVKRIKDKNCVGVIFFVSENSITSKAVREEIRAAKKRFGKPIPVDKDCSERIEGYFSVNIGGKSAKELKKELKTAGSREKVSREFLRCFPPNVIYIPRSREAEDCTHLPKLLDVLKYYDILVPGVCDEFRYEIKDDGIMIMSYTGEAKDIVVPEKILGMNVTAIANDAFKMNKTAETVALPDTVRSIGEGAFREMTALRSVKLPKKLDHFGEAVFKDTPSLRSLTLPYGPSVLGDAMFRGSGVTELVIPDSVKKLGEAVFVGCENLETVVIPDSVVEMTEGGFRRCGRLKNLTIPQNIKGLETSSFSDCPLVDVIVGNRHYHDGTSEELEQ